MMTLERPLRSEPIAQREKIFAEFYETAFHRVAEFISQRKGTLSDAKDIFQDAIIILYEKKQQAKLEIHLSEDAYLLGIAKHLWIRKFNRDRKNISLSKIESAIAISDDYVPEIQSDKLVQFLEHTGRKCMELLTSFYYHKNSIQQIMNAFGYANERSATVQKYKCLEKIRDKVKEKSINYEDFTE